MVRFTHGSFPFPFFTAISCPSEVSAMRSSQLKVLKFIYQGCYFLTHNLHIVHLVIKRENFPFPESWMFSSINLTCHILCQRGGDFRIRVPFVQHSFLALEKFNGMNIRTKAEVGCLAHLLACDVSGLVKLDNRYGLRDVKSSQILCVL